MNKLQTITELGKISQAAKAKGKKVALVHGVFDILHQGHILLFEKAKKISDVLIVGLDCDENATNIKGKSRPFNTFEGRLLLLKHIDIVDYVFEISSFKDVKDLNTFFSDIYKTIKPTMIVTNIHAGKYGDAKKRQALKSGIEFVHVDSFTNKQSVRFIELFESLAKNYEDTFDKSSKRING